MKSPDMKASYLANSIETAATAGRKPGNVHVSVGGHLHNSSSKKRGVVKERGVMRSVNAPAKHHKQNASVV